MPPLPEPAAAQRRWLLGLSALFGLEFVLLGLRPHDRADWALENGLVVPFVALLLWRGMLRPLSRRSYALIFAFLALHEIGSHYTYSLVPYQAWCHSLTGHDPVPAAWQRNHFDRAVHLGFGLLLANPLREVAGRLVQARPAIHTALSGLLMLSLSASYELIEWLAAESVGRDLGIAYVGAQGDVWDAQKDTALAFLGTGLSLTAGALLRWHERCTEQD
jgi:putative membrane protein